MERSFWQEETAHASFDPFGEYVRKRDGGISGFQPPKELVACSKVPVTSDTAYDPTHPMADWAGLCRKRDLGKKCGTTPGSGCWRGLKRAHRDGWVCRLCQEKQF
eukprot:scaffold1954_cov268-Pinguiococcus_pyrenoidosus.AAC.13